MQEGQRHCSCAIIKHNVYTVNDVVGLTAERCRAGAIHTHLGWSFRRDDFARGQ